MNTITEELKSFTDEELYHLQATLTAEVERRKRQYEANLIENFHKAWGALKDCHIKVKYLVDEDGGYTLTNWDKFEFGD